ncbi:MAG: WbqC family protein [Elusimicrobiota bacterium]
MIVAAHQPNFIPWLGYFDKMQKADLFVSVDHVQMERQSFQNRTAVKTGEGVRWLTVPVVQNSRDERIVDKRIDNSREGRHRWSRKMLLTLKYAYQSAPHFAAAEPALAEILDARWERLSELNHRLIDVCRAALGIRTPMLRSSEMSIPGAKSEMVLNLCREVGADAYLSGSGASKGYLDLPAFERAGIRVIWQDFEHPRYPQLPAGGEFVDRLSALDLILNCGPQSSQFFARTAEPRPLPVYSRQDGVPA